MSEPMDDLPGKDPLPMGIGIVGTGAVASSFAAVLGSALAQPSSVLLWGRRGERARELAERARVRWAKGLQRLDAVEAIILAVSDDAVEAVAREVAAALPVGAEPVLLHTGGARTGAAAMGPGAAERFELGSIHPLVAVPKTSPAGAQIFESMPFAIEANGARALACARRIVGRLGGDVLELPAPRAGETPEAVKLRYHALATMVATGVVTLVDRAAAALATSPEEAEALREAYGKLASSAARNVTGTPGRDALTGALARGDEGLLRDHAGALDGEPVDGLHADVLRAARAMLEDA